MINPIEKTYLDTCSVYRMVSAKQSNGSLKQTRTSVYSNIPCAYSVGTRPALNQMMATGKVRQTDVADLIKTQDRMYLNPSYTILQGDEIVVTRYGRTYNLYAGRPFVYDTHQQLHVQEMDYA